MTLLENYMYVCVRVCIYYMLQRIQHAYNNISSKYNTYAYPIGLFLYGAALFNANLSRKKI